MKNKKIVSKKPTNAIVEIKQLHACIAKDQAKLTKLYKKAISDVGKKWVSIKKLIVKAKKAVAQAKKTKKKSPKNYDAMVSLYQSLMKEFVLVKAEQSSLKTDYKKFTGQNAVLKQNDKVVAKAAKQTTKTKSGLVKTVKQKRKVKVANKEAPLFSEPNFEEEWTA